MRFMQCHAHRSQLPCAGTELTALNAFVQPLENDMCQKLCCRVAAFECGLVVEVPVVQIRESGAQSLACQTDVNDDAVFVEVRPSELDIHDICRAVELLSRTEYLAV